MFSLSSCSTLYFWCLWFTGQSWNTSCAASSLFSELQNSRCNQVKGESVSFQNCNKEWTKNLKRSTKNREQKSTKNPKKERIWNLWPGEPLLCLLKEGTRLPKVSLNIAHCTLLHCTLQIAHCTFHIAHCQFIERLLLKHCYWYILLLALLLALLLVHIVIETFIAWQRLPPSIETLFPQLESLQMQLVPRLANLSNLSSGLAGLPWCLNWPICLPDGRQLPW